MYDFPLRKGMLKFSKSFYAFYAVSNGEKLIFNAGTQQTNKVDNAVL